MNAKVILKYEILNNISFKSKLKFNGDNFDLDYKKFINEFDEELNKQGYDYRLSRNFGQNIMVWFTLNRDIAFRVFPRYMMYIGNKSIEIIILSLFKLVSTTDFGKKFVESTLIPASQKAYRFIYDRLVKRFYDYSDKAN